jgi:hypothetical protein
MYNSHIWQHEASLVTSDTGVYSIRLLFLFLLNQRRFLERFQTGGWSYELRRLQPSGRYTSTPSLSWKNIKLLSQNSCFLKKKTRNWWPAKSTDTPNSNTDLLVLPVSNFHTNDQNVYEPRKKLLYSQIYTTIPLSYPGGKDDRCVRVTTLPPS